MANVSDISCPFFSSFQKNFGCAANASAKAKAKQAYDIIKEESKKLGSMKFAEIAVLILFILLVLLWFTRDPGFIPGWATVLFNKNDIRYHHFSSSL